VNLILLSVVPSLMAGLSVREQKPNVEHHVVSVELPLQDGFAGGLELQQEQGQRAD
jgi:hypothetical protein